MKQELINLLKADCQKSLSDYKQALSVLRDQSILVTGGTGFVGKWIAEAVSLLNHEHGFNIKLYILARNVQEYKEEVPHLAKLSFITLLEQDVRNVSNFPDDISYVIHAAGSPDNRKHTTNPLKTIDTIYRGTHAVLDACLRLNNLNKVVHISSNSVYGQLAGHPDKIKETQIGALDCNTVNSAYSEGKRLAETVCAIFRNQQKLPIVIVRPFAFIGPYQGLEKPWAINNFIRDGILGGPIRILGNEETVRSYLYGSDMAFWLLKILANSKSGETYNIGGEQPISLKTLASKVTSNFTQKIEILIRYSKQYPSHPSVSVPDIDLIKSELKVKQVFDFDTALKKTIDWYKTTD
ncbi:NAD-dependent epimerase/dehydratase family protein [Mucilaginibacter sp. X5P1]|uniref:NAD-dependent epimerase/dehydratase family protein n=1 Tax=Mucilaginibacter sp. X5P1 TaxID=2723088 RepID=UPI001609DCC5|nr:NAD-dependent epimerase/dehydratase family protein [Mucilaginibacter sp. X5P1]MBB6141217.1 dTDP-glucose 4,6-dehydratase [Mucilaginibacter sp. X5P1]